VRREISKTDRRVLVHGLPYFGRIFADFMNGSGWEFRYYPDVGIGNLALIVRELAACDVVYQLGGRVTQGRFLRAARLLRKKKLVMHWLGSDVLDDRRSGLAGNGDPWVVQQIQHWAQSDWMLKEVTQLGVRCDLVPFPSALVPDAPLPLPKQFRVLVYMPTVERAELYGLDRILSVARSLPEVSFDLVGLLDGPIIDAPNNLSIHGRIDNLLNFYRSCCVVWRPTRHDGVSWMVLEAIGHGRHVLWTYPFPGCIQVNDWQDARDHISRLYDLHRRGELRINEAGVSVSANGYEPKRLRANIRSKLEKLLEA